MVILGGGFTPLSELVGVLVAGRGRRGPLSQRERDGVREDGCEVRGVCESVRSLGWCIQAMLGRMETQELFTLSLALSLRERGGASNRLLRLDRVARKLWRSGRLMKIEEVSCQTLN